VVERAKVKETMLGVDAQNQEALTLYTSAGFEALTESQTHNKFL
jgi:ribosomal protein S18 acetylase RimI-like enzyme